jgi:hypothetical protein
MMIQCPAERTFLHSDPVMRALIIISETGMVLHACIHHTIPAVQHPAALAEQEKNP